MLFPSICWFSRFLRNKSDMLHVYQIRYMSCNTQIIYLPKCSLIFRQPLSISYSPFCIYIISTNEIPYLPAYIVSAIAGFVLSYVLISFTGMGVWALVVGNGAAQLAYNNWKWPIYLARKFSSHYFALIRAGLMQWSCALKK